MWTKDWTPAAAMLVDLSIVVIIKFLAKSIIIIIQ